MKKESKARAANKATTLFFITFSGLVVASVFSLITFGLNTVALTKAIILGVLITLICGYFELFIFPKKLKNVKFVSTLLLKTLFYVLVITIPTLLLWVIHESMVNNTGIMQTIASEDFNSFIFKGDFRIILFFSLTAGFLLNFFAQISSLIGKRVFLNYLSGRYNKPKVEVRTFMFLDLTSSTTIAENLGPLNFHRFMNEYFYDIDGPIIESKGEIYQYVGDEVIISWIGEKAFRNNNCIECYFRIRDITNQLEDKYLSQFGIVPAFKGGVHTGEVVAGEIGDSKKEIVFHGDVMNTASRIQSKCKELGKELLISHDVWIGLSEKSDYDFEELGKFVLKGKMQDMKLYSVTSNRNKSSANL